MLDEDLSKFYVALRTFVGIDPLSLKMPKSIFFVIISHYSLIGVEAAVGFSGETELIGNVFRLLVISPGKLSGGVFCGR